MTINVHAFGDDVFEAVEFKDEDGKITWKLKAYNGDFLKDSYGHDDAKFDNKDSALWEADRWVRRNPDHKYVQDKLVEKVFEHEILE